MQEQITALEELYNRTPRRHTAENIKEIISILSEYESLLQSLEGSSLYFEKNTPELFSNLDTIRQNVKLAADNKASKKNKDNYFDIASGILKDDIQQLMLLCKSAPQ